MKSESILHIKLIAFIINIKERRENSCIYKSEKKYILAKEIGISVNTFSSYLNSLFRLKLAWKDNDNNIHIEDFYECIRVLRKYPDIKETRRSFKYMEVWKKSKRKIDFKKFYPVLEALKEEFLRLNISQQTYRLGEIRNAQLLFENSISGERELKALKRLQKRFGFKSLTDFEMYLCTIDWEKTFSRTGKFHLANILGVSEATAARYLQKWNKQSDIFILKKHYEKVSDLPNIKGVGTFLGDGVFFDKKRKAWYRCKGREVILKENVNNITNVDKKNIMGSLLKYSKDKSLSEKITLNSYSIYNISYLDTPYNILSVYK